MKPKTRERIAGWLDGGANLLDSATSGALQGWKYAAWNSHAWLEGGVFPAVDAVLDMNRTLAGSLVEQVREGHGVRGFLHETADRFQAARRFSYLVETVGREVFGSATFPGEVELATSGPFKLTWLPPAEGAEATGLAVFHAGGSIPYGDGIFRLTQDYNFYERFLERGVGVYAMEVRGDRYAHDGRDLTMDGLVDAISELSTIAWEHNQGRRMALEGYCGHGTQALVYLAAKPEEAARRFHTLATFVAPVDGRRCGKLAESIRVTPERLMSTSLAVYQRLMGYVPAGSLSHGLDTALGANFAKTPMGYFSVGWARPDLGGVRDPAMLSRQQRRDLAGAYWISPEAAKRWPVPADITRYTTQMFTKGVGAGGELPWTWRGQPLSLADVVAKTDLRVMGFYGGHDTVVPDQTAHVMMSVFKDRYTHVVHPQAGHISYVLSPRLWSSDDPRALRPNPLDLLLQHAAEVKGA